MLQTVVRGLEEFGPVDLLANKPLRLAALRAAAERDNVRQRELRVYDTKPNGNSEFKLSYLLTPRITWWEAEVGELGYSTRLDLA